MDPEEERLRLDFARDAAAVETYVENLRGKPLAEPRPESKPEGARAALGVLKEHFKGLEDLIAAARRFSRASIAATYLRRLHVSDDALNAALREENAAATMLERITAELRNEYSWIDPSVLLERVAILQRIASGDLEVEVPDYGKG